MVEHEGDVDEGLVALQRELALQRQSCAKLRERVASTREEKASVMHASLAGVEAARAQILQMRQELEILQSKKGDEDPVEDSNVEDKEAETSWRQMKLLECRNLRHELSKWQHQASTLEAKRPADEEEVQRLKAEVMHAQDILESTRHACRHLEVEQSIPNVEPEDDDDYDVLSPKQSSAHSGVQVLAEKHMREKAEERGAQLAGKAKRLGQVLLAQKLLIQRLEKQIAEEELRVEQKELRLAGEEKLHLRLKVALRQRSDEIVVDRILGKLPVTQRQKDKVKQSLEDASVRSK